ALFPHGTLTCLDAMSSYISANPKVVGEFRAAMNEAVTYASTHQSEVKQTLVSHLQLSAAIAEKQVLNTDFSTSFNTASMTEIGNDMKQFGIISSAPPSPSSMIWSP